MTPETMISSSSSSENNSSTLKNLERLSSVLFLVGASLWFTAMVITGPGGKVLEKTIYGIAFGCLVLHVLPEVILDLRYPQRPSQHSRYGTRSRWINLLQSALFTVGAFFQGASYWSWVSQDDDPDHYTSLNIFGAFFWLASGILIAVFQGGCFCCGNMDNAKQSVLHRTGNLIYITTTVIFVLAGFAWKDQPNEFLGYFMEGLSILLLILVGILYVGGDIKGKPPMPAEVPRAEASSIL